MATNRLYFVPRDELRHILAKSIQDAVDPTTDIEPELTPWDVTAFLPFFNNNLREALKLKLRQLNNDNPELQRSDDPDQPGSPQ
jgi:hypothetical protein